MFHRAIAVLSLAIVGCSTSPTSLGPRVGELDRGDVWVRAVFEDRQHLTVWAQYVVERPLDDAWALSKHLQTWWQRSTSPFSTVETISKLPHERLLRLTWKDGMEQDARIRYDDLNHKLLIELFTTSQPANTVTTCNVKMEPYSEASTRVSAEMTITKAQLTRLGELVLLPAKLIVPRRAVSKVRSLWQYTADAHRKRRPPLPAPENAQTCTHIISIGINTPNDNTLGEPPVAFAESDAAKFFDWASKAFPSHPTRNPIQEHLVGPAASSTGIGRVLRTLTDETIVKPGDTIILYFAGHMLFERPAHARDLDTQPFLQTHNAEKKHLTYTSVLRDDVVLALDQSPAERCVLVLDSCYSGGQRRAKTDIPKFATRGTGLEIPQLLKTAVVAAARSYQPAVEDRDLQSGVLTHYWMAGARGMADKDGDRDGTVTLDELCTYLTRAVDRHTDGRQIPHMRLPDQVRGLVIRKEQSQ